MGAVAAERGTVSVGSLSHRSRRDEAVERRRVESHGRIFSAGRKAIRVHGYGTRAWRPLVSGVARRRQAPRFQPGGSGIVPVVARWEPRGGSRSGSEGLPVSRRRRRSKAGPRTAAGRISDSLVFGWPFPVCDGARSDSRAGVSCGFGQGRKNILEILRTRGFGGD